MGKGNWRKKKITIETDESSNGEAEKDTPTSEQEASHELSESEQAAAVKDEAFAEMENEAKENYEKYLRAMAELENFKKRSAKERADILRYAGEHLAYDILEVVDNFERALSQSVENGSGEDFVKGVKLIHDQFVSVLGKHQIRSKESVGKPFDPELHTAMTTVPTPDQKPGTVIEEFKKAYYFKDKLLRTAQVVVSKAPEAAAAEGEKAPEKQEKS